MSLITIDKVGVLTGTIMMPLVGVWTADLVIDQPDGSGFDPGTAVTIMAANGVTLSGTVSPNRTGDFLEAVHVRVLGGAAGMGKPVTPRAYMQPGAYVRDVLNGIASDSGETLSTDIDASFVGQNLAAWNTVQVPASQALVTLLDIVAPTFNWRILEDGKLWMGAETWPTSTPEYEILEHNPTDATFDLGVDSPAIAPGVNIDSIGNVNRVEHTISADKIRTRIWVQLDQPDRGIKGAITALVNQAIAGIDYFALYDAKVVSQSSDGTMVDLQPGDSRLPGMGSVPLRGQPGVVAMVAPGSFVRLGWDRGDPSMPYAGLWQGGETLLSYAIGSAADNVITKQDFAALISAISAATYIPYPSGAPGPPVAIVFVPPTTYASNIVKVQR